MKDIRHKIQEEYDGVMCESQSSDSAQKETDYLLSIPGMRESILEGMKEPISECSAEIDLD